MSVDTWLSRALHPPLLPRLTGVEPTPEEEEAFWLEQRVVDFQTWRLLMIVIATLFLAWWPTDKHLFAGNPMTIQAFADMRLRFSALTLITVLLITFVDPLRRHAMFAMSFVGVLGCLIVGESMGRLGGISSGWFHMISQVLFATAAVSFRLYQRVLVAAAWVAALLYAFCIMNPHNRNDPNLLASLSFLFAMVLFCLASGYVLDRWRMQNFLLRRAVGRQARELASLNESLEHRVAEQTAELRQLANSVESTRESERSHLSRELHDELGQELTAMRLELRFARLRYTKEPAAIDANLNAIEKLLDRTAQTTRNIVADLRPRVLDDLGLCAAAEWLVKRTQERTELECHLEMPDRQLELPPDIATAAFRILQESLTNVARHAQATTVRVQLQRTGSELEVIVQDNGRGIPEAADPTRPRGAGLLGMRERTVALKGTLSVGGKAGQGTTVHARLPLPAHAEARAS